jgi:UDP-N-acetylglucosamine 2-epimerase
MKNPYEGSHTSQRIVEVIEEALNRGIELKKKFYDWN